MKRLSLAVLVGATLLLSASAARTTDFSWGMLDRDYQNPVEGQSLDGLTVTNTTGCAWDVDDGHSLFASGSLAAGAVSRSQELCLIGDTSVHLMAVIACPARRNQAVVARLVMDLSASQRGVLVVEDAPPSGCARLCASGVGFSSLTGPYMSPIEGSGGGVGMRVPFWIEVENPNRRNASISVQHYLMLDVGNTQDMYCPGGRWLHERGECYPYIPNEPGVCWLP